MDVSELHCYETKMEQLIFDLKEIFEVDEKYTVVTYFKEKTGVLLAALSLVATFLVFSSKISSYLTDILYCRYWNLDERFIVENNRAYLKLGVYLFVIVIISISIVISKKYAYLSICCK